MICTDEISTQLAPKYANLGILPEGGGSYWGAWGGEAVIHMRYHPPVLATKTHFFPTLNCLLTVEFFFPNSKLSCFHFISLCFRWRKEIQGDFCLSYSNHIPLHVLYCPGSPSRHNQQGRGGMYNPTFINEVLQWTEKGTWTEVTRKTSMGRSELQKGLRWTWPWEAGYELYLLILLVPHPFTLILIIGSWYPLGKDPIAWP